MSVVAQKEYEESTERRIEGYETHIAMLSEEIEQQASQIESLSRLTPVVAEASEKNEAVVAELRRTVQELKQKGESVEVGEEAEREP